MKLGSLVRVNHFGKSHYGIVTNICDSIITIRKIAISYNVVVSLMRQDYMYWITDVIEI